MQAERRQRSAFLRTVYREYDGARLADLDAIADEHLTDHVLTRLSPEAVRRIREHRRRRPPDRADHRRDPAADPPAGRLFDHIEAAELAVDDRGVCTGYLASSPLVGESRAAWMRSLRRRATASTSTSSYGYADSHSDLPLLEAVGRPVAVRPDVPLFRHARTARWTIVDWAELELHHAHPQPRRGHRDDARAGDVPVGAAHRGRARRSAVGCPASCPGSPRRCGW